MRLLSSAARLTIIRNRVISIGMMTKDVDIMNAGDERYALDLVEAAVNASLIESAGARPQDIDDLSLRESAAIANRLRYRLGSFKKSGRCRRCWLEKSLCVCDTVQPLALAPCIRRIFVIMHHKEIALTVDTAKLIFAAFPDRALVIVNGLRHQPAEEEMHKSIAKGEAIVLFPSDDSVLADQSVFQDSVHESKDLIILDGTWSQAQKLHRSLPATATRIRLSDTAINHLAKGFGKQLRPHPTKWKEVSTLEALRLLFVDLDIAGVDPNILAHYQSVANAAALKQLGTKRLSPKHKDVEEGTVHSFPN
uniref:tRNA-uridine aminocarboxypropyltransferase n=1 Tax=Aureoumbra lagunensis TaxID=44058 RepID=A0A7S3JV36_9STRA|mmetsp:Transcript_8423/g.11727  ORF Transcript_8423/g.11727 Transcript_8423/m.11727 type:complete len:308 (-) Transcript_8423:540-1463(-)